MTHSASLPYSDRLVTPAETWERITPLLPQLGITRVARLTGLDRIGIPVWNAVAPNARTIVISQGKGIEDIDARVSAAMEAAERAIASQAAPPLVKARQTDLNKDGYPALRLDELIASGAADLTPDDAVDWIAGVNILDGSACYVPYEAVQLDRTLMAPRFWQSSDGLASGNTHEEATFHGLLERIERDAYTLWQLTPIEKRRVIDPKQMGDPIVDLLIEKINRAGFILTLFDMTTDIAVPCFTSLLAPADFYRRDNLRFFEVNMGSGAHPCSIRAAIRAITEAAQSRMTFVSGARDDIPNSAFTQPCPSDTLNCLNLTKQDRKWRPQSVTGNVHTLLHWVLEQLKAVGISDVIAVDLSAKGLPISVTKVVVPQLENPDGRRKRRYGARAFSQIMKTS